MKALPPMQKMRRAAATLASAALCVALMLGAAVSAQAQSALEFIRVEGNQRIEAETVRTYMTVQIGAPLTEAALDQSVKSLFASGLFADVTIRPEGAGLVVRVVENPVLNRIAFEGNRKISDKTLLSESGLKPREVYTRNKVQNVVERFVELYRRSGRFAARVVPKVIRLPQNRVDLVFEIQEGAVTKVRSINFVGNRVFSDFRLRQEITTVQSSLLRLFSSADNYDPDRINFDKELLRRFYLSKGYADFRVISAVAELSQSGRSFFITFTIEEGRLYRFGPSRVISELPDVPSRILQREIQHRAGRRYNAGKIDTTIDAVRRVLGERGYAFADVQPRVARNKEAGRIRVDYVVEDGPRVYVDRINISGNTRTQDRVIRRELRLDEGDAFNRLLLSRGERNIRGLGYFGKVDVSEYPGEEDDRVVVDIGVAEQSTGELTLGVGYSSVQSVRGDISLAERNFLGRGQTVRLSTSFSEEVQYFNGSFTEPYFLGRDLLTSVDAFHSVESYRTNRNIRTQRSGGRLEIGFPLSADSRLSVHMLLNNVQFRNRSASAAINPSYESFRVQGGYTYFIDKRDDRIEPTAGWDFLVSQEIGGPSGFASFLRTTTVADLYLTPIERWILRLRVGGGYVFNYRDEAVSYSDRFFRGGLNFRGFERLGVGPRSRNTGYALGANAYVIGTVEQTIPLGLPRELGIRTALFVDFGWIGETDAIETAPAGAPRNIQDEFAFRASYGLSIAWRSPLGPVRFDLARAVRRQPYDDTRFFNFSIGASL